MPTSAKPLSIIDQSPELRPKSRPAVIRANILYNMNFLGGRPRAHPVCFMPPLINRRLCKIAHSKAVSADRPAAVRVVPERMQAGGKLIAVAKARITEAGREAIAGEG
jgi:hypothetical protein